jgi:glycosyltransferase involved in cell wall biosynthesis
MKILILQDYLRNGGTERHSVLLSREFAAAGHAIALVTFRPGGALDESLAGGERKSLQSRDLGLDWFAPRLGRTVRDFGPDIVLTMGRMANCYAGHLQRLLGHRPLRGAVIATMRTGKPLPWLFRRSLRACRHIVANSEEARSALIAREGLPPEKITVIRNSLVFPAPVAPPPSDLRARVGAGPGSAVLLSVAMFRPEKNQRELIEIAAGMSRASEWQLWLAGDGPSRPACERLVRERGLGDRIKFPGFFPDPGELYAAADIAVHASRSESLSNFLIEAQAHGVPAVAYEAQGIRECFLPGDTGWAIPAGERPAFQAAVAALLAEGPPARGARRERARQFARRQFDPARQVQAYLGLFARLRP